MADGTETYKPGHGDFIVDFNLWLLGKGLDLETGNNDWAGWHCNHFGHPMVQVHPFMLLPVVKYDGTEYKGALDLAAVGSTPRSVLVELLDAGSNTSGLGTDMTAAAKDGGVDGGLALDSFGVNDGDFASWKWFTVSRYGPNERAAGTFVGHVLRRPIGPRLLNYDIEKEWSIDWDPNRELLRTDEYPHVSLAPLYIPENESRGPFFDDPPIQTQAQAICYEDSKEPDLFLFLDAYLPTEPTASGISPSIVQYKLEHAISTSQRLNRSVAQVHPQQSVWTTVAEDVEFTHERLTWSNMLFRARVDYDPNGLNLQDKWFWSGSILTDIALVYKTEALSISTSSMEDAFYELVDRTARLASMCKVGSQEKLDKMRDQVSLVDPFLLENSTLAIEFLQSTTVVAAGQLAAANPKLAGLNGLWGSAQLRSGTWYTTRACLPEGSARGVTTVLRDALQILALESGTGCEERMEDHCHTEHSRCATERIDNIDNEVADAEGIYQTCVSDVVECACFTTAVMQNAEKVTARALEQQGITASLRCLSAACASDFAYKPPIMENEHCPNICLGVVGGTAGEYATLDLDGVKVDVKCSNTTSNGPITVTSRAIEPVEGCDPPCNALEEVCLETAATNADGSKVLACVIPTCTADAVWNPVAGKCLPPVDDACAPACVANRERCDTSTPALGGVCVCAEGYARADGTQDSECVQPASVYTAQRVDYSSNAPPASGDTDRDYLLNVASDDRELMWIAVGVATALLVGLVVYRRRKRS